MNNGVKYVREICKQKKIPVSKLEKDCGFSNGYLNPKKATKIPYERALVIAEYLNVNVEKILGVNIQPVTEITPKDERDIAKDLENIMNKLTSGEAGPAAYDGEELSPEAAELFRDELEIALRRLKLINKEKYNPNKNKK